MKFHYQLQKSNINMYNGHSGQEHLNNDTIWFLLSPVLGQFFFLPIVASEKYHMIALNFLYFSIIIL